MTLAASAMAPVAHMFRLEIDLPSTLNLREHFMKRARRNKAQRSAVALLFPRRLRGVLGNGTWPAAVVTITRVAPRALDGDNHQGACKGVRDQIAAELGVDDRDARVAWIYAQRKGAVRERAVEIRIERAVPAKEQ